ncbi:MAG: ChrB protein [Pleurocapsa sp. SU_196_0]|nr:ChrB protein [Pleurocapsa sp. SU_196_0]
MKRAWLILHYQLEREPSAPRVSVWRKLKKLGAVLVQDTLWVLPDNARTREQFRWLAAEVVEHGGNASVFVGSSVLLGQDEQLERQFQALVEPGYRQLLEAFQATEPNLAVLSKQFQVLQSQDHLHSALGEQVRLALEQAKERA